MIFIGGFGKAKAAFFALMGVVFIVIGLMSPSIVRSTFIIIGVCDIVAAVVAYLIARSVESKVAPYQQQAMQAMQGMPGMPGAVPPQGMPPQGMPPQGQVPGQGPTWG